MGWAQQHLQENLLNQRMSETDLGQLMTHAPESAARTAVIEKAQDVYAHLLLEGKMRSRSADETLLKPSDKRAQQLVGTVSHLLVQPDMAERVPEGVIAHDHAMALVNDFTAKIAQQAEASRRTSASLRG